VVDSTAPDDEVPRAGRNDVVAAGQVLAQMLEDHPATVYTATDNVTDYAFDAYPSLEAPEYVAPEEQFEVIVGFRDDVAPELLEVQPIHIDNPPPGAKFQIILMADGGEILDGYHRPLPLDKEATVKFTCKPKAGVSEIILTVDYLYEYQPVGMAKRRIVVTNQENETLSPAEDEGESCRVSLPSPDNYVDLIICITRTKNGSLNWIFSAPHPPILEGPIETSLEDPKSFSSRILRDLKNQNYKGEFAASTLENIGQTVSDTMPPKFFEILHQVYQEIGRKPTVLLLTQEKYVPWELAVLENPLDPSLEHPFLASQTDMGRWLRDEKISPFPPTSIPLQRFTIVASEYGEPRQPRRLLEAIKERDNLKAYFKRLAR